MGMANVPSARDFEMYTRIKRAATDLVEAWIATSVLQRLGWSTDPRGAIERFRTERQEQILPEEAELGSWTDTVIHVFEDRS